MISSWRRANCTVIHSRYHVTLQRRYERESSLTGVEVAVLGKVCGDIIELVHGVVATVAVERDAGGEVDHEGGQGADLLQDVLVLLQHERHVGWGRRNARSLRTTDEVAEQVKKRRAGRLCHGSTEEFHSG